MVLAPSGCTPSPGLCWDESPEAGRLVWGNAEEDANDVVLDTTLMSIHPGQDLGCDVVLSVIPYYNKPTQDGMYEHFAAVAKVSALHPQP